MEFFRPQLFEAVRSMLIRGSFILSRRLIDKNLKISFIEGCYVPPLSRRFAGVGTYGRASVSF